jgi:hypothetical protein
MQAFSLLPLLQNSYHLLRFIFLIHFICVFPDDETQPNQEPSGALGGYFLGLVGIALPFAGFSVFPVQCRTQELLWGRLA